MKRFPGWMDRGDHEDDATPVDVPPHQLRERSMRLQVPQPAVLIAWKRTSCEAIAASAHFPIHERALGPHPAAAGRCNLPPVSFPPSRERPAEGEVWTIGHSTHSFADFLDILRSHHIETVADVRRFPGSRRYPHFGGEALAASLAANGLAYHWFAELGGRRRPDMQLAEGSAWRHPSFRAYAQHLHSDEFAQGLIALLHTAKATRTAVMCSELLWWRCHRRLIADVLLFGGWQVTHILGATEQSMHRLAPPVQVRPEGLSYAEPSVFEGAECC